MLTLTLAWQLAQPVDPRELQPLYEESVARKVKEYGGRDRRTVDGMRDLAGFLLRNRLFAEAEPWLRRIVEAEGRPQDAENLGDAMSALDRHADAAAAYDQAGSASSIAKLAAMANGETALALYRKALALEEKASGVNSTKVAVRLNDLALVTREEPLFRRALAIQEKAFGPRHPEVATTLNNLASLLMERGRAQEAEPLARRAYAILETTLGRRNVRTAVGASNLADILRTRGNEAAARTLYNQALAVFEEALGADHAWTREAREALAAAPPR